MSRRPQGSAQQAVVDGAQLDASLALALIELVGAEEVGEGGVVAVALVDPGSRRDGELGGAVGLFDVDEPGPFEQFLVAEVRGDSDRAVAVGTPSLSRAEP